MVFVLSLDGNTDSFKEEESKEINEKPTPEEENKKEEVPDFSHLPDDSPVKSLCMKHPSLQACQQHIKRDDQTEHHKHTGDEDEQDEKKEQKKISIASYIKGFTRWMNSWIFAIVSYVSECTRCVVKTLLSYSFGMVLVVAGKEKVGFALL